MRIVQQQQVVHRVSGGSSTLLKRRRRRGDENRMGVAQRPITTVAAYVALIFIFPPSLFPCLPASSIVAAFVFLVVVVISPCACLRFYYYRYMRSVCCCCCCCIIASHHAMRWRDLPPALLHSFGPLIHSLSVLLLFISSIMQRCNETHMKEAMTMMRLALNERRETFEKTS